MWTSQSSTQQLYVWTLQVIPTQVQLAEVGKVSAESWANGIAAFLCEATPAEPDRWMNTSNEGTAHSMWHGDDKHMMSLCLNHIWLYIHG